MSNTTRCPLCGGPNDCGIAQGKSHCWCFSTAMPPDVLARVPESQRNAACLCRACAETTGVREAALSATPQPS